MTKKTQKKFRSAEETKEFSLEEFSKLTEGVIFISETDAGLEPFVEFHGAQDHVEKPRSSSEDSEEVSFEKFFDRLTARREWHTAADQKRTAAYSKIRKYLEKHLTDLRVVRSGKIRIDIVVFGKTPDGSLAGFRTRAVET
ncbi:MAG: hypothetical protein KF831_14870 [Acidobacteria bacterium]|nr:hypothetical protein [Acidobacteriota bacterium]